MHYCACSQLCFKSNKKNVISTFIRSFFSETTYTITNISPISRANLESFCGYWMYMYFGNVILHLTKKNERRFSVFVEYSLNKQVSKYMQMHYCRCSQLCFKALNQERKARFKRRILHVLNLMSLLGTSESVTIDTFVFGSTLPFYSIAPVE